MHSLVLGEGWVDQHRPRRVQQGHWGVLQPNRKNVYQQNVPSQRDIPKEIWAYFSIHTTLNVLSHWLRVTHGKCDLGAYLVKDFRVQQRGPVNCTFCSWKSKNLIFLVTTLFSWSSLTWNHTGNGLSSSLTKYAQYKHPQLVSRDEQRKQLMKVENDESWWLDG